MYSPRCTIRSQGRLVTIINYIAFPLDTSVCPCIPDHPAESAKNSTLPTVCDNLARISQNRDQPPLIRASRGNFPLIIVHSIEVLPFPLVWNVRYASLLIAYVSCVSCIVDVVGIRICNWLSSLSYRLSPSEKRLTPLEGRVTSMLLQQQPSTTLWLGLGSGHLLLVNSVTRTPMMVVRRHVSAVRGLLSVKALVGDKPSHLILNGGLGFLQRPPYSLHSRGGK